MKTAFILFILLITQTLLAFEATVTYIQDGDTIKIEDDWGDHYIVRLWGIDAPESYFKGKNQGTHAFNAKKYLRKLLPLGAIVSIITDEQVMDGNNRLLARIFFNDRDINKALLSEGHAVPYLLYPFDDELAENYIEASHQAFLNKRNIFNDTNPLEEMPYQFRMRIRNWTSSNYIANFYTKKYYEPDQYDSVPAWKTVFFESWWDAEQEGYYCEY